MDYKKIKKGKDFNEFLEENFLPKIQIGDADIYYIGEGFFAGLIDNSINNIYFFSSKIFAEKVFLKKLNFVMDEGSIEKSFILENGLYTDMSFEQVKKYLNDTGEKFMEGASYNFKGEFNYLWIDDCKNYVFHFFGQSKKTKMGAFTFYLYEQ
ncbi:MAG: hypothetical protein IJ583_08575 [Firmicutes bacterium]|nr:hypothetical protein [Bacillota bacterium]